MNEIFLGIIKRIKEIKKLQSDAQVAKALDMTKNNLYAFKNRPSLPLKQIHTFCSREGVRLEYLIDGKLPIRGEEPGPWPKIPGHGFGTRINNETQTEKNIVREPQAGYSATPPDILLKQTAKVLHTKSVYKDALDSNIKAFHAAVEMQEELDITKAEMARCMDLIQKQQITIEQQQETMNAMKADFQHEISAMKDTMNMMQEKLKSMDGG